MYSVIKLFDDLPCAHRAWAQGGNCVFLHGYERSFELTFEAEALEIGTGFVVDFSRLKGIRKLLESQFDHTTVIAEDDPMLAEFERMHELGVMDLRVMTQAGMEGAAQWVLENADAFIRRDTGGRVRVVRVLARESRKNAVTYERAPSGD